ncbi:MAG: response regulator, partial [Deltaproteobacteria bacterium]|nr:response regulator [Candidatus Tharpella sp.]
KRVLIVDDNSTWREVLENLLRTFQLDVVVADSGLEALVRVGECLKKPFDLILMDWHMPGLDGIETAKLINESCASIGGAPPTVIMVSAFRHESIVNLAKDVGIQTFLQKPVNPSVLHDVLSEFFAGGNPTLYSKGWQEPVTLKTKLPALQGKSILLAEDNSINQEIVLGLLDGSGINIDVAGNGRQAVELWGRKCYDLILMDLQMPVMDGYEATKIIRKGSLGIPIIALTANAMADDMEKTQLAGMNDHLNKPIEVEKLYELLLHYLADKKDLGVLQGAGEKESGGSCADNLLLTAADFHFIDIRKGLTHLAGNESLYVQILKSFVEEFSGVEINLEDFDQTSRTIHTLKGLSANIGALSLNEICHEFEGHPDAVLLPQLYERLQQVIDEIENNLVLEINCDEAPGAGLSDEIFAQKIGIFKVALARRRSRECLPVLEDLRQYKLNKAQKLCLDSLDKLVKARDFKAARAFLDGGRWC